MADMEQWRQDRALRDTAKSLVTRDLAHLRGDVEEQGVGSRMMLRMREGTQGLAGDIESFVRENPSRTGGALTLGIGLVLVWLFSDRIAASLEKWWGIAGSEAGPSNPSEKAPDQGGDPEQVAPETH